MAAALDADGLVETRVGIDVCDLEAARNFGPARRRIRGIRRIGIVLCGHKRDVSADGIPRRILERQRGLVVGARDGDGHGLQIPGAVLVLHIDGEGIRHLGAFRQSIDGTDVKSLAVQRDRGTFRQLHLLTLQGVDPGAVTVQGQGAENAGHGVTALHASVGGFLAQEDTVGGHIIRITMHDAEIQLVTGVHIMAGHLARQLLGAIVRIVLVRAARIPHDVAILIAAHTALEQVQLRVLAIKLHRGLVIGTRDGDGHVLAHPGALVVLHEDGESIRHRGAFRQVVQGQLVAVEIPSQFLFEVI